MPHRGPRWLTAGAHRFLWAVGHFHTCETDCAETVRFRREGSSGHLLVVFQARDGHTVADYLQHQGTARHADGRYLNLNKPGVIRALLDEAIARGWRADATIPAEMDGWDLFDAVFADRAKREEASAERPPLAELRRDQSP
jgi:hypothetical protein